MITNYINSIIDLGSIIFKGDGEGEYEQSDNDVSDIQILKNYIEYCEDQIAMAKCFMEYKNRN